MTNPPTPATTLHLATHTGDHIPVTVCDCGVLLYRPRGANWTPPHLDTCPTYQQATTT